MEEDSNLVLEAEPNLDSLPKFEDLLQSTHHLQIYTDNGSRLQCLRCQASVTVRQGLVRPWLASPCTAIGTARDKPTPITYDNMIIGRQAIHSSHKPYIYRGLIYCNRCGAYSGTGRKIDKLVDPCQEPKRWGKDNKKAIENGQLPRGLSRWPIDQ